MRLRFIWASAFCAGLAGAARGQIHYSFQAVPLAATVNGITNSGYVYGSSSARTGLLTNGVSEPRYFSKSEINHASDAVDGGFWITSGTYYANTVEDLWYNAETIPFNNARILSLDAINRVGATVGAASFTNPTALGAFYLNQNGPGLVSIVSYKFGDNVTSAGGRAISNSGYWAGNLVGSAGDNHVFVIKEFQGGSVYNDNGRVVGINDSGQVLIRNSGGFPVNGWIRDVRNRTVTQMGNSITYRPESINRWGQVVCSEYGFGTGAHVFIWNNGVFTNLSTEGENRPFDIHTAVAINDRGQVVGINNNTHAAAILTPAAGETDFFPRFSDTFDSASASANFSQAVSTTWYALSSPGGTRNLATSEAYQYAASDQSTFKEIKAFPRAYVGKFSVSVAGVNIGSFDSSQSLNFSSYASQLGDLLTDGGVKEFTVSQIKPEDEYLPLVSFALKLGFNDQSGAFQMHARNNLLGDANGDHVVDFTDFQVLESNFYHQNASWFDGDFNLDGTVDPYDFFILRKQLSTPLAASDVMILDQFAASVPEPTMGLASMILGAIAMLGRPKSRTDSRRL